MTKIMFICLGNICRSPMAEFVFKDLIEKQGISHQFYITSAGTSNEEVGNGVHYGTVNKLKEVNIKIDNSKKAVQFKKSDYDFYDYLICMEQRNVSKVLSIIGKDTGSKVKRLLDYTKNPRDISDPWYTGNFDATYENVLEGCKALLEYLKI